MSDVLASLLLLVAPVVLLVAAIVVAVAAHALGGLVVEVLHLRRREAGVRSGVVSGARLTAGGRAVTPMPVSSGASAETPQSEVPCHISAGAGSAALGLDGGTATVVDLDDFRFERAARGGAA